MRYRILAGFVSTHEIHDAQILSYKSRCSPIVQNVSANEVRDKKNDEFAQVRGLWLVVAGLAVGSGCERKGDPSSEVTFLVANSRIFEQ
jgi:hypothetical protein